MRIKSLHLKNFRNYTGLDIEPDDNLNLILGTNAQGKTNLLEALAVLAGGRSFRTRTEQEMLQFNKEFFLVSGLVQHRGGTSRLKVEYDGRTRQKNMSINGLVQSRPSAGKLLSFVLFTPEGLDLVKGSPQERRRFIDEEICKVSLLYEKKLSAYQRIIRQRNRLLKFSRYKGPGENELECWDEQLAPLAAAITAKRQDVLRRLGILARLVHRKLTGSAELLEISYKSTISPSADSEKELGRKFLEKIKAMREKEILYGQTMVGPHRDDIQFLLNGLDARVFASQGQQRTLVLSLKLAELEFIRGETGEYPVILFDDVFSELDQTRRRQLMDIFNKKTQVFITGTEADRMGKLVGGGRVFWVKNGEVSLSGDFSPGS